MGRASGVSRETIISVRDLVGGYGEETILQGVSFDVYAGEIFVILGASGCGKSTLLKHLIGLQQPVSGDIIIDGDNISHCDQDTFQRVLRKFGVLFQGAALLG